MSGKRQGDRNVRLDSRTYEVLKEAATSCGRSMREHISYLLGTEDSAISVRIDAIESRLDKLERMPQKIPRSINTRPKAEARGTQVEHTETTPPPGWTEASTQDVHTEYTFPMEDRLNGGTWNESRGKAQWKHPSRGTGQRLSLEDFRTYMAIPEGFPATGDQLRETLRAAGVSQRALSRATGRKDSDQYTRYEERPIPPKALLEVWEVWGALKG